MVVAPSVAWPVVVVMGVASLACSAPSFVTASLAGVVGARVAVSTQVKTAARSLEALQETTLLGPTVLVHHALEKADLAFLINAAQRKASQLSVFNHTEWRRVFWAPAARRQRGTGNPDNIIIFGIVDFMYMRHLICKVQVFVIYLWFESLDAHLLRTKAI